MHNNHVSNMINGHHAFCRHTNHVRLEFSLGDQQQFVQQLLQHSDVQSMHNNYVSNMIKRHNAFCRHTNHVKLEFFLGDQQQFVQQLLQNRDVRF